MTGKIFTSFSAKVSSLPLATPTILTLFKRVFVCFLALFEIGSLLCAVATSSKMLIVGRAVAGMGGSGITNGALSIIALCLPMEKRPSMKIHSVQRNYLLTRSFIEAIGIMMGSTYHIHCMWLNTLT